MPRVLLALALVPALLAAGSPRRDHTPPVFDGALTATTCIPGPASDGKPSSFTLTWKAARDDRTPPRRIVYLVYATTASGGEHYTHPTWTSRPGATTFATPKLSSAKTWWFVVRARDAAGNRDRNRHEVEGVNVCD